MKLIVDASVAVKWMFTEEGSVESRQLLAHRIVLYAPDFILTEAANVLWKKARRKEIADPQPYLEELARLPDVVVLCPSAVLVARASAIALEIAHPVYDCLYLACAEVEGAPLVTADGRLRDAAEAYPGVDVWHIAVPEVRKRIVTAATTLVIQESTLQELIAAYAAFSGTVDTVIDTVPRGPSGVRILTPEDQDVFFDTPAYRGLVKRIASLSDHERIDLKALAWFGRERSDPSPWSYFLNHAYRTRKLNDDPEYEAGLGGYWQAGLDRLREEQQENA